MLFTFTALGDRHEVKTKTNELFKKQPIDYGGVNIDDFDLLLRHQYGRDGHIFNPEQDSNVNLYAILKRLFPDTQSIPELPETTTDKIT